MGRGCSPSDGGSVGISERAAIPRNRFFILNIMEGIDFHSIPARALNYSSRILLGKLLNPEQNLLSGDGFARDYRGLAEQMEFGFDDIRNFQRKEDPTMKILEEWTTQPSTTIGKLIKFLENMGRHDVIQDLQSRFENDAKVYLQQMEKYKDSPLQVPEVTSCRPQYSKLDELNVLTRDDAFTGECTLYDAYISYADEDIHFVYNLVQYLESSGFKLFIRCRDLLAGHSEYETNMQLIKERCKRVLIVLSPDYIKCPACEVQASFAAGLGIDERCRKIVPILWKPCQIPLILKFVARIDFTKPGIQDWIWDTLKFSLLDVSSNSFISSKRRPVQGPTGLSQLESSSPETSNPAITFPSTSSSVLSLDSSSITCSSSTDLIQNDISIEAAVTTVKTSKQKNKLHNLLFWQNKKNPKKGDSYFSSASVSSSSNVTSGFHSQSGNGLESIDISNEDSSQDTPV
ncbi:myeloid differentiation primary response protein MyD88 [Nephila pilipes]|uniref:Myeloid differentiation primary response protein MyD88 n=1 Tax=Nephila pilipes TaxID=299642 RepID=A0A8X6PGU7_NEPPI|nr:myeloid differentiation primary response protein MyD88 [Nephila pilipes]